MTYRIMISAIGQLKSGGEKDLFDTYLKQTPWRVELLEHSPASHAQPENIKKKEALKLLSHKDIHDAYLIALDERGKSLSSQALSRNLQTQAEEMKRPVVFCIGGAYGLDDSVRQRADLLLSFGAMTWPHKMVRAMLAEQIYRSYTILSGHPYHK